HRLRAHAGHSVKVGGTFVAAGAGSRRLRLLGNPGPAGASESLLFTSRWLTRRRHIGHDECRWPLM
ncbi:MAG: hypothetical protein M3R01_07990, partial [Actinomycetota bacterium]|nr:hypothetical protein [Actinomycetota bacterium]